MWIISPSGFFSIVEKPEDRPGGMLTVRARVGRDLDRLRSGFIPLLDSTIATDNSDYRYRARAPRTEVAEGLARAVSDIGYVNFKDEVSRLDGPRRATVYGDVWYDLRALAHLEVARGGRR